MSRVIAGVATLGFTLISAAVFILMSIIFFFLNVWIIKVGAGFAGFTALSGDWVVMSAAILSAATVISSALRR
ncbi:MAG: hypothetical protein ACMXX9_01015 [Candidatus Woesearchaeota archaeon]